MPDNWHLLQLSTELVDKGRDANVVCLDLCKVVDAVPHNSLATELERYG